MTKYMPAGEFKAKCLKVMEQVAATGEEVVVTKHGKPVARLVAAGVAEQNLVGRLKGTVTIRGDIVEPTGERWDAEGN
jgi:prevent-host-death family protein